MAFNKSRGFTVLELLVVLVVVGILASIAVYALSVSRAMSRDAKRVSDISVLRSGLSQYWLQRAGYPVGEGIDLGSKASNVVGLTNTGFTGPEGGGVIILQKFPVGPKAGEYYHYKGTANGYSLRFTTERETAYGPAGIYYAHSGGVDKEDVEK